MNRVSWYVIVWRLPWWVLAHVLRVMLSLVMLVGWGRHIAVQMWEDTK